MTDINTKESSNSSKILLVDDNPQNLQVLGKLLQEMHYEIEFATSGLGAIDWLNTKEFDLVFLDINMPEMDGYEVCNWIRSENRFNKLPVIFLSADSNRESVLKGFELGAQDYVTKPFDSRELISKLKTHIGLKNSLENFEKLNQSFKIKALEHAVQLSKVNEELEKMNQLMMNQNNAKFEFIKQVSNEIWNPLNTIINVINQNENNIEINRKSTENHKSVKRFEKSSNNALLISKLKTNNYNIRKDNIDIQGIIMELLEDLEPLLELKKLKVKRKNGNSLTNYIGDYELIKKCVFNVLEYAIEFSPYNSFIEICTFFENEKCEIEIADNSKGISQDVIDKGIALFHSEGKDLDYHGLYLSQMIMVAHGGNLHLANKKTGGGIIKLKFI